MVNEEQVVPPLYDVIIVGAGPCGLAVATRLCEHTPSAIFTDEEHHRYHWIRKHAARATIKNKKTGRVRAPTEGTPGQRRYSTLVLDATADRWMAQWNRLFKAFEITHLRSPMFFHPDPGDRDGLLAFTHEQRRERELVEIPECVGKEISKHKKKKRTNGKGKGKRAEITIDERDRKDYFTPSASLFNDYCDCIIDRYGLKEGLVRQEKVLDIDFGVFNEVAELDSIFRVSTDTSIRYARTVVLAVGAANAPRVPLPLNSPDTQGCCHAMRIQQFPDAAVTAKIRARKSTNILVVGGGLTSAQVADMAIRYGVSKVWHIMRGPLKVKPFDVDLSWMGKFKNHEKASFWSADSDEERLEQIKDARGGGSITPRFHKILKQHIAAGNLTLRVNTTVKTQAYDSTSGSWYVETCPPIGDLPPIDYIYYCTGIQSDFSTLPFLKTMNAKLPVHGHAGLPCLTDDLMWSKDVPLFVTGRLASLRLGPGAGNLEGARVGAERIAWSIAEILGNQPDAGGVEDDEDGEYRYRAGIGSRFSSLDGGSTATEQSDGMYVT